MNEVKFDEWLKFDLRIGEVKNGKVDIGGREFELTQDVHVEEGDKIVVGVDGDKLVVLVVNSNVLIVPESDVKLGCKVR